MTSQSSYGRSQAAGAEDLGHDLASPLANRLRPPAPAINKLDELERVQRELVLESCRQYFAARPAGQFVAGETYIPVTGKVLDAEDLVHLVDASLDLWL